MKAAAMMKTPKRSPELAPSRKRPRSSRGFQTGVPPNMTADEEETMIPINEVMANPTGMVMSCDHNASLGFLAKRAKSGSLT